mgnify:CR=1 FL=1
MYTYTYVNFEFCGGLFMNKSRKNRKMHIIAGIVAIALILYASVTLISIKAHTQRAQEQKAALEQKIDEVTEENAGILFEKMKAVVPEAECNLLYGGQPLYDYIISVE